MNLLRVLFGWLIASFVALAAWLSGAGGEWLGNVGDNARPAGPPGLPAEVRAVLEEAHAALAAADPADRATVTARYADEMARRTDHPGSVNGMRFGAVMEARRAGDAKLAGEQLRKLEASDASVGMKAEALIAYAETLSEAGDHAAAVAAVKRLPRAGVRGLDSETAVQRSAIRSRIYAFAGEMDAAKLSYLSEAPAPGDAATSIDYLDYGMVLPIPDADFDLRLMIKAPAGVQPRHLLKASLDKLTAGDAEVADAFADMLHERFPQSPQAATHTLALARLADTGARRERAAGLYERILANPNAPAEVVKQAAAGLVRVRPPGGETALVPRADPISRPPGDGIERDPAKIGEDDL